MGMRFWACLPESALLSPAVLQDELASAQSAAGELEREVEMAGRVAGAAWALDIVYSAHDQVDQVAFLDGDDADIDARDILRAAERVAQDAFDEAVKEYRKLKGE